MTNEELMAQFMGGDESVLTKLCNKNEGLIRSRAKEIAKADIGTGVAGTPNMDPMLNADLIVPLPEEEEPAATEE